MRSAVALAAYRFGNADPTTRLTSTEFWRATFTPDGPATLHIDLVSGAAEAWGPGAAWMLARVDALTGALDPGHVFVDAHPAIMAAQRTVGRAGEVRFGASGTLYHELLPTILGQRITAGEAVRQWHRLVAALGAPAPGPNANLLLPPDPSDLVGRPAWWFHPLGIEASRANALRTVARHAQRLFDWASAGSEVTAGQLALLPGIGQWTIGLVLATALGDPDAVAVGDFHLKHVVVHTLTGRARGTDGEMLELLEPYRGQRGRVVRLLVASGASAPKFGPRRRIESITRR